MASLAQHARPIHTLFSIPAVPSRRAQRGVYALEFGLVFLVLFAVLYGVLTYGLIFTAKQSLTLAAQDGARAALRWTSATDLTVRAAAARSNANAYASWMESMGKVGMSEDAAPLAIAVCSHASATPLASSGDGDCSGAVLAQDQLEVYVRYRYAQYPLIPTLPGLGLLMVPADISARAIVQMGSTSGYQGN